MSAPKMNRWAVAVQGVVSENYALKIVLCLNIWYAKDDKKAEKQAVYYAFRQHPNMHHILTVRSLEL